MSGWFARVGPGVLPSQAAPQWVWEQSAKRLENCADALLPSRRATAWRRVGSQRRYWQRDVWYELRARRGWRGKWCRKRREATT